LKNSPFRAYFLLSLLAMLFLAACPAGAGILTEDTVWEGEILLADNLLVPQGITLTVRAGASISVVPADSTRTDPEYMSSLTEITVRGGLVIEGTPEAPVTFGLAVAEEVSASWAGIIVDGGAARIASCIIQDAETGIWIVNGHLDLHASTLAANRYGLLSQGKQPAVSISETLITRNEYGLLALEGALIDQRENRITGNLKKDIHYLPAESPALPVPSYTAASPRAPKLLQDEVLLGDVVWQGHLLIDGLIRLPPGNRLIILPGTVVEFKKKDSNGDGIGENGLMLQGVLIAKGTAENPILFRSAEKEKNRGDWDAINIFNSDGAQNLIEYCQLEDAYRGLHFHFANVAVQNSIFRNNYRGVQFQESAAALRKNIFHGNISAVQARDSQITFNDNKLLHNIFGASFFRSHLDIRGNTFGGNLDFGLKIREGYPTIAENVFHHNRFGLMVSDAKYGSISGNLLLKNAESGLSIRTSANMGISGNFIQANGFSGISIREAMAVIDNNHISENGERGIGLISFYGSITGNDILHNGLYAIAVEDGSDISAPLNWYGRSDIEGVLYHQANDPSRGRITYAPAREGPSRFQWPLPTVPLDLNWYGDIIVPATVALPANVTLKITPGTNVLFAAGAGMEVRGRLLALGSRKERIKFTALAGREAGSWGEIHLEHAAGSRFSNCDFEYATWGIHGHFTPLPVIGCSFQDNVGGIRFRSGPLTIKNSRFSDNTIGIRSFIGNALITNCIITRNENGIFVRERGGGLKISNNNIFANNNYNIRVGDFNTEDIEAVANWWGNEDPAEKIFDASREPGIGFVHYQPALGEALEIEIVDN
jgi:hypothetical protein